MGTPEYEKSKGRKGLSDKEWALKVSETADTKAGRPK